MKKLFVVLAIIAISVTIKAQETETKVSVMGKSIIHDNPNYTEVFEYTDTTFKTLVKIVTIDKTNNTVASN